MGAPRPQKPRARAALAALLLALPLAACAAEDEGPPRLVASSGRVPFHLETCNRVRRIPEDKFVVFETRQEALDANHTPCNLCKP